MIAINQNKPIKGLDGKLRTWEQIEEKYVNLISSNLNNGIIKILSNYETSDPSEINLQKEKNKKKNIGKSEEQIIKEKESIKKFSEICSTHVKLLLVAQIDDIKKLSELEKQAAIHANKELLHSLYENIRKNHGYWFAQVFGMKVCPYCNNQFVLSLGDDGEALYQLDHFYNKDDHPLLAISINNLIPCCASCNLHKSKNGDFLNPLTESFHDKAKFGLQGNIGFTDLSNRKELEEAQLILEPVLGISPDEKKKVENHKNTFRLEAIYNLHKDIVEEIYWKKGIYSESQKKEIRKNLTDFGIPDDDLEAELKRFILGNYYREEDFHKRIHTKLIHDIAKELGLI